MNCRLIYFISSLIVALCLFSCKEDNTHLIVEENAHIVLIGNNLCSRMIHYDHFETELHLRYPEKQLYVRNMCDGGDTPGFRPHSGRNEPWAFPRAAQFQDELAKDSDSQGFFEMPDEWLTRHQADIILAFFGYNESFAGEEGLENFKAELDAFIKHTLAQQYNGVAAPQLAIVSPIAFEDLSNQFDLPNGMEENKRLALYSSAMQEIASANGVLFVDVFTPTQRWFAAANNLTIDGFQMNNEGYAKFGKLLADKVFGKATAKAEKHRTLVHEAVLEKNWMWHNDYKSPNGVHVFGRRYNPFGPENYPAELKKIREMTAIRDEAIWKATQGEQMDLTIADAQTYVLPAVETNYKLGDYGRGEKGYLYGDKALATFTVAEGFKLELFASEKEFPDLANPVQLSFDNKGRLWVATMPSYPHYKPGDAKPNDKLIILEDTNGDGKADKQTIFADGLHLPTGFELAPEGVYLTQGTNFVLLQDTNGDDKADKKEILLSGFDDHDTHHVISAYCADPSGALYMAEGVFLHTNVESPYGPVRATNGGFFRYNPARKHLERTAQLAIPNPWGIAFDDWGQPFFTETSGPDVRWMMPGTIKPRYGVATHKSFNLIEEEHKVRPTSGLEFVSSRHFPNEMQGDMLINNTIGFLGTKQHQMLEKGTGYATKFRQNLVQSSDGNFRPVDMEFAPDGSLYVVDWHNVLVGHMQHNARDPLRDHVHGRIYRITYPARPLVEPASIDGASIEILLNNLKLPEYRTRYRTRRELRGRDAKEVLSKLTTWANNLNKNDPQYEHHLLEGLWVSWGLNQVEQNILKQLLQAKDYRARAAAVRVLRYTGHQVKEQTTLLEKAASDEHGRVRLEAIVAASWLNKDAGLNILEVAAKHPLDEWMIHAYETAKAHLNGYALEEEQKKLAKTDLKGEALALFQKGQAVYEREGSCQTCHQATGKGLVNAGFPPLVGTGWILGSPERLIKLTLHGLYGPIVVHGVNYPGQVPMTGLGKMLTDEEVASVLTYVRNTFGNKASAILPEQVKNIRAATKDKKGFYTPEELLKEHPME